MERIDAWRTQIESIRVTYDGRERLSYGAYFYQAYFGIEEAWPIVALALWGRGEEAQRQAGIMLEPENLAKDNVHHQSRNGAGPAAAAAVARLTDDRRWLASVAPTLLECARWTERVRQEDGSARSPATAGFSAAHLWRRRPGPRHQPVRDGRLLARHGGDGRGAGVLGTPALVAEARALDAAPGACTDASATSSTRWPTAAPHRRSCPSPWSCRRWPEETGPPPAADRHPFRQLLESLCPRFSS
jgi:hypothetical protein